MNPLDTILITGLEFYGFHGASNEEQTVGHRYQLDIKLGVDTRAAGASDALSDTVNYAEVTRAILEIGATARFRLVEALAQRLVDRLFELFPRVQEVEMRVQKRLPPMNAVVQSVGVEIRRQRNIVSHCDFRQVDSGAQGDSPP